jgi:hypothetical protein
MTHEPEVTAAANLRDMRCPYPASDPRAEAWLDGYLAGANQCFGDVVRVLEDLR